MKKFNLGIEHRILNNEVRKRRLERGYTQKQLASLAGCNHEYIGALENLRLYPREDIGIKLAEIFETDIYTLFPQWLKVFKPKRTKMITEHLITNPMLNPSNDQLLLMDGEKMFEDIFDKKLIKEAIEKALATLSDRERRVIEMRFGFNSQITDGEISRLGTNTNATGTMTLEEVGREFGVTKDRIRQIEARALRRLRHSSRNLKEFL